MDRVRVDYCLVRTALSAICVTIYEGTGESIGSLGGWPSGKTRTAGNTGYVRSGESILLSKFICGHCSQHGSFIYHIVRSEFFLD